MRTPVQGQKGDARQHQWHRCDCAYKTVFIISQGLTRCNMGKVKEKVHFFLTGRSFLEVKHIFQRRKH